MASKAALKNRTSAQAEGGANIQPIPTSHAPRPKLDLTIAKPKPTTSLSGRQIEGVIGNPSTSLATPPQTDFSAGQKTCATHRAIVSGETELRAGRWDNANQATLSSAQPDSGGQISRATQASSAAGNQPPRGPCRRDTHPTSASGPIDAIVERWRQRMDMMRARQRLELQAQAVCRRVSDGDKTAGGKLWATVKKDAAHPMRGWLNPFLLAMEPLAASQKDIERELTKLVKELPIYDWAGEVSGLGEVSLAGIVGELAAPASDYRNPSCIWKRMGLAVVNGGRQRRVTGADALEHGYNAERRSLMWNIGGCLMKAQIRSDKDDKGKKIEGSERAIGDLGQVYLDRKRYLNERNDAGDFAERAKAIAEAAKKRGGKPLPANSEGRLSAIHIHNDAKRYMEKRLLRQLWQEWRRATAPLEPKLHSPAAENQMVQHG